MPSIFLDYAVATSIRNHTPHDTNALPGNTIGISCVVTTAGILKVLMHCDSSAAEIDLGLGTHFIDGNFKLVYSTGSTAVLTGTRVTAYIANPANSNY